MRFLPVFAWILALLYVVNAVSIRDVKALSPRGSGSPAGALAEDILSPANALAKRKGGGGRSGGGGGGGKSSGGGASNSRSDSNAGGRTVSGSGVRPAYGGGRYYGGGATVPYAAGQRSPLGLVPLLILPLAALAIFPGLWLYSVYQYPYTRPYTFVNQTITNVTFPNGINQTLPVDCLCQQYSVCGCDDNNNSTYLYDLIGNGSYAALNKSLVTVSEVNGSRTIVINGTLPNGTTASGGTDSPAAKQYALEFAGWWVMGVVVLYSVAFL
ncbi:hypothetical protein AOQ84DRAFT_226452 [Glonium stellatum]|uniref:DUF7732 domain-containing protein n=1 Tax=Glonium stellatum TaxID=574774 RepID=A0A8E2FA54_9PEZI|nr:hypothetical protein AOQ84DRAFT_226452 [Glonium stellatum]